MTLSLASIMDPMSDSEPRSLLFKLLIGAQSQKSSTSLVWNYPDHPHFGGFSLSPPFSPQLTWTGIKLFYLFYSLVFYNVKRSSWASVHHMMLLLHSSATVSNWPQSLALISGAHDVKLSKKIDKTTTDWIYWNYRLITYILLSLLAFK